MNDFLLRCVIGVTCICVSIAVAYLWPYVCDLRKKEKFALLFDIVEVAVRAAEQTIKSGGKDKKEAVMLYLTEWAQAHGIKVSAEQINQLIEAAVFGMNQIKEG